MAATKLDAPDATPAVRFDVINQRAQDLGIGPGNALADFLGYDRTTVWRWRNGLTAPKWEVVIDIARKLGISIDEIRPTASGEESTGGSPPAGPQTPPPPSGPKAVAS